MAESFCLMGATVRHANVAATRCYSKTQFTCPPAESPAFPRPRVTKSLVAAEGLAQELIALAQHLCARLRVFEIMIKIVPRHQFVFHACLGEAIRHHAGFPDPDVAVE